MKERERRRESEVRVREFATARDEINLFQVRGGRRRRRRRLSFEIVLTVHFRKASESRSAPNFVCSGKRAPRNRSDLRRCNYTFAAFIVCANDRKPDGTVLLHGSGA